LGYLQGLLEWLLLKVVSCLTWATHPNDRRNIFFYR
jgi:hypothetical protein